MRSSAVAALATLLPLFPLAPQEAPPVHGGDRVRVISPTYSYVGTVVRLDPDSLVVEPDGWGRPVQLPLNVLTRVDLQDGRHHVRGAIIGALIGATFGGVAGVLAALISDRSVDVFPVVGLTGGIGGGVGAFVGGITAGTRWRNSGLVDPAGPPPVRRAGFRLRLASHAF